MAGQSRTGGKLKCSKFLLFRWKSFPKITEGKERSYWTKGKKRKRQTKKAPSLTTVRYEVKMGRASP